MQHLRLVALIAILGGMLIVGWLAYSTLKEPAAASGPLQAVPLATSVPATTAVPAPTSAPAATTNSAPAATQEPAATSIPITQPAGAQTFQIAQAESEARFIIDEVLNNQPKTVIGTTNQVAGQIVIDPQDPTKTKVGVIQVNARTLTTDNEMRNRAIKNRILLTDQYELVSFTPTEVKGLPTSGAVGTPYSFSIVGDLTIGAVTQQVTFEVTTMAASEDRLEGSATAIIKHADFGIQIPSVRQVASVAEQVRLEFDFVALPV